MSGPTEATCGSTIKQLLPNQPVSLGGPTPSTRIYIMDEHHNFTPRGAIGEIYLAGVQVSAGYVGRPEDTAARFFQDSVLPGLGERMYKTGDKAYWNEIGELMLVGRSDRQVKVRGFRIDLDGLEMQMLSLPGAGLQQVAVTVSDGELTAHVQPKDLDLSKLRETLRARISHYSMPRWIRPTDTFPRTVAGKRDYKRLEEDSSTLQTAGSLSEPTATLETVVMDALRDTLTSPADMDIKPTSNFFDLGVSSVSLLFLSHRLSRMLDKKVSLRLVMQSQTPRELAIGLQTHDYSTDDETNSVLGETAITPIENEWWHKYQHGEDTAAFNVTFACQLGTQVNVSRLASAWDNVLARHRILSCNYLLGEDSIVSRIYQKHPPKALRVRKINIDDETHTPFKLGQDHLIRVFCSPETMLVVASHIICDLTTLNKLLEGVANAYSGQRAELTKTVYSQTLRSISPPPAVKSFWIRYLERVRPIKFLEAKTFRRTAFVGNSYLCSISKYLHRDMKTYTVDHKVTMHQLALAAVSLALQVHEESVDILIGAPYLNRGSEQELETVGLFLQPLPIRIKYTNQSSNPDTFIPTVQASSRLALSHALPFDQLLSALSIPPAYPDNPLLDVMVTFHEAEHMPKLDIEDVVPLYTWTRGAKFKLMAEFAAINNDELTLRLEYSTECFTEDSACIIGKRIVGAMHGLVSGHSFTEVQLAVLKLA